MKFIACKNTLKKLLLASVIFISTHSFGQIYPNKPIEWVVPLRVRNKLGRPLPGGAWAAALVTPLQRCHSSATAVARSPQCTRFGRARKARQNATDLGAKRRRGTWLWRAFATTSGGDLADAFRSVGAFALPAASKDAAIVATLAPGNYTAQVAPVSGTAGGTAIVEVYELP